MFKQTHLIHAHGSVSERDPCRIQITRSTAQLISN